MIKEFKDEIAKEISNELGISEQQSRNYMSTYFKTIWYSFLSGVGVGFIITLLIYIFIIK